MYLQIIVILAIVVLGVLWFVMRKKEKESSAAMDSDNMMSEVSEEPAPSEPAVESMPQENVAETIQSEKTESMEPSHAEEITTVDNSSEPEEEKTEA